jgi:hypothetical protein
LAAGGYWLGYRSAGKIRSSIVHPAPSSMPGIAAASQLDLPAKDA